MQTAKWVLTISMIFTPLHVAHAAQGDGLVVANGDLLPWSRWQARLLIGTPAPLWRSGFGTGDSQGLKPRSLSLMGDYLFHRSVSEDGSASYLRATSGLVVGPRPALWAGQTFGAAGTVSIDRRQMGDMYGESSALPYLGIGYSGLAGRSGWSFSADFGLVALAGGNVVRLGRVVGGNQGLDDLVRELRLSPVLQFGASYAF
jgi:hypothetical protein